ncbi:hypothetical protein QF036_003756 [Arthrobacter globiformis]|nr:hypothetical protein [Arthrobacter globiformis]
MQGNLGRAGLLLAQVSHESCQFGRNANAHLHNHRALQSHAAKFPLGATL